MAPPAVYFYDGSSTESELYDDEDENEQADAIEATARPTDAKSESLAVPEPKQEALEPRNRPPAPSVAAAPLALATATHNVLDLLSISAATVEAEPSTPVEPLATQLPPVNANLGFEDGGNSKPSTSSDGNEMETNEAEKPLLPQSKDESAASMSTPGNCSESQRDAPQSNSHGSRRMFVPKLAARPQPKPPSAAPSSTPRMHPAMTIMGRCTLCCLPIELSTPELQRITGKMRCSCCKRAVPASFYSPNQATKGSIKRCKGCAGNFGSPSEEEVWQGARRWRKENAMAISKFYQEQRANEQKAARASSSARSTRTAATVAVGNIHTEAIALRAADEKRRTEAKRAQDEKVRYFHASVARYRSSVGALARKRAQATPAGMTRSEYMAELAKEEAALGQKAAYLKKQNKRLFMELMKHRVDANNTSRGNPQRKRESTAHSFDPSLKRFKTDKQDPSTATKREHVANPPQHHAT